MIRTMDKVMFIFSIWYCFKSYLW